MHKRVDANKKDAKMKLAQQKLYQKLSGQRLLGQRLPGGASHRAAVAAMIGLLFCGAGLRGQAAPRYRIVDLGALSKSASSAACLNTHGQAAGEASTGNGPLQNTHAFLWYRTSRIDLGTLGGKYSAAAAINGLEEVVGIAQREDNLQHAFLSDPAASDDGLTDLGTLGGETSAAYGLNNLGQVVGTAYLKPGSPTHHAFLWQRILVHQGKNQTIMTGKMEDLGTLGGNTSAALAINDLGQSVGMADAVNGDYHACLWSKATSSSSQVPKVSNYQAHDLGTLGGRYSIAHAINSHTWIVGQSVTSNGEKHAFLYQGGKMQDLHPLGSVFSDARGINDRGQVVGSAELPTGQYHAYGYQSGQTQDLNALISPKSGWILEEANGINSSSQIVGSGQINGQKHAFLLDPM